jgi:hypothetical protein
MSEYDSVDTPLCQMCSRRECSYIWTIPHHLQYDIEWIGTCCNCLPDSRYKKCIIYNCNDIDAQFMLGMLTLQQYIKLSKEPKYNNLFESTQIIHYD